MASLYVYVDLDDVDLDELIEAIDTALNKKNNKEVDINKSKLASLAILISKKVGSKGSILDAVMNPNSLDEITRYEHLCRAYHKYTTPEIEMRLPL